MLPISAIRNMFLICTNQSIRGLFFLQKVHISKYVFSCGKCGFLGDFFKLALTSSHSTSHLSSFWGLWTFAWWAKGPPKMIHVLPLLTCYLVVFSRVFHFLCTFCTNLLPTFWILVGFLVCGFQIGFLLAMNFDNFFIRFQRRDGTLIKNVIVMP